MAKIYGTLVGAPVQNLQTSGFGMVSNRFKDGVDQVLVRDTLTFAGNVIGDQISLATLKSTAFIDQVDSVLWYGAGGASCVLNIGDVNHANALAASLSIATAGSSVLQTAFAPAWLGQPLWQRLGYSSDPGGNIELLATIAGANPANVAFAWQIFGRNT